MRDPERAGSFESCNVIICAMQIESGLKYELCLPDSKALGENTSVTVKYGDMLELTHYAKRLPISSSDAALETFLYSFIQCSRELPV